MVNSGAIMSSSILLYLVKPEMDMAQKYDYVFDFFKVSRSVRQSVNKDHYDIVFIPSPLLAPIFLPPVVVASQP